MIPFSQTRVDVFCSDLLGDKPHGDITNICNINNLCPFVLVNQNFIIIGSLESDFTKPSALIFPNITLILFFVEWPLDMQFP